MISRLAISALISALTTTHAYANAGEGIRQFHVSKSDQMLRLYENGQLMEEFRISTGKKGYETPSGIFSIIHKRKYHESNIYSNAPMPFMQRLTWSGIALHEGRVPNYPASHGCIRIPKKWAQELFNLSHPGTVVITTQQPIAPSIISHPFLPGVKKSPARERVASLEAFRSSDITVENNLSIDPVTTQSVDEAAHPSDLAVQKRLPLKLLITWRDQRDRTRWSQIQLTSLGFDAGIADGLNGPATNSAFDAFKRWKNLPKKLSLLSDEAQSALASSSFAPQMTNGVLRIRQNFKSIKDYDIEIADPHRQLGTHFLQAISPADFDKASQWTALTLPNQLSTATRGRLGFAAKTGEEEYSLTSALERLTLPAEAQRFLEDGFSTEMALTITDYSQAAETGEGTEFITVTKDHP